ncbi:hypothetical protein DTO164E3_5686 [Paecilomyces variotii]|nr:hypothetical protein DTO164E3_5686 [Paecilomyces variotii]KAJ9220782.1 hypothetical protein DTO169C6_6867 [Paecilomyces variotii]KAJ9356175.1 hypothetical protein DTO027B9_3717 [Paecilomyces variotii]
MDIRNFVPAAAWALIPSSHQLVALDNSTERPTPYSHGGYRQPSQFSPPGLCANEPMEPSSQCGPRSKTDLLVLTSGAIVRTTVANDAVAEQRLRNLDS